MKAVSQAELWMVLLFLLCLFPVSSNSDSLISQLQYLSPLSWIAMAVLLGGKFNKNGFSATQFSGFSSPIKITPLALLCPNNSAHPVLMSRSLKETPCIYPCYIDIKSSFPTTLNGHFQVANHAKINCMNSYKQSINTPFILYRYTISFPLLFLFHMLLWLCM